MTVATVLLTIAPAQQLSLIISAYPNATFLHATSEIKTVDPTITRTQSARSANSRNSEESIQVLDQETALTLYLATTSNKLKPAAT